MDPEWQRCAEAVLGHVSGPRHFDARRGLFGERRLSGGRTYAHLWPFSCAWSAAETAADLVGPAGARATSVAQGCFAGLAAYAPPEAGTVGDEAPIGFESAVTMSPGQGGDVYYDDNAWVALALLEHHRRHGHPYALALARRVTAFCCSGWSVERRWAHPGGIRWKVPRTNTSRNTCANAPVAQAAAIIHSLTGDPDALVWAVRIYDWVRAALLGPDGLYLDRILPDGTRAPERWTYNQGTMIGAGVLLAEVTGEGRYLAEAESTAEAALAHGGEAALALSSPPAFNAIFFRNLFLLERHLPDIHARTSAASYCTSLWDARPRGLAATGLGRRSLLAAAPLVELYALMAGATPHA